MELRHLRYFVAVAEERNLTKAAKKLYISQPPLTRSIMQLEEELEVQLFIRKARGLELTSAGSYFLDQVRQLLDRLETTVADVQRISAERKTIFSIGFEPSILYGQLPLLFRRLRKNKNLELVLHEMMTHEQQHALKTGKIDLGFGRVIVTDQDIHQEVLFNEPLMAALPSCCPLAQSPPTLAQLAQMKAILFSAKPGPSPSFSSYVHHLFYQHGLRLNVVQQVNDLQTALSLVASDMGFALVPEQVSRLQRENVVYTPIADCEAVTSVIASRRANDQPSAVMRLATTILDELIENRRSGRYPPQQTEMEQESS